MKQLSILIIKSLIFTSPCLSMEPAENLKTIPFGITSSSQIKQIAAVVCLNNQIIIGGQGGCESVHPRLPHKTIDSRTVFTINANLKKDLVVVSNEYELFVYNPDKDLKIWKNNSIPEKNISAVFGPNKTVITLNPQEKTIAIFDYENKNTPEHIYALESSLPFWPICTSPISYNSAQHNYIEVVYPDTNNGTSLAQLSDFINIQKCNPSKPFSSLERPKEALWSPNGRLVAIARYGCIIWNPNDATSYEIDDICNEKDGILICNPNLKLLVASMAFHPNGCLALIDTHNDGCSLIYFNLATKKLIKNERFSYEPLGLTYIKRLDFSPDGTKIALAINNEVHILPVPEEVLNQ